MKNAGELYDAFRDDMLDTAAPYLWSRRDVWRYINDAHRTFVKLTGGVADVSSSITRLTVVTGEYQLHISDRIMRIVDATLVSTGVPLKIVNYANMSVNPGTDYIMPRNVVLGKTEGDVRLMVIGRQKGLVELHNVPVADDEIQLSIKRYPLETLESENDPIVDVDDEHHEALLMWMKRCAYLKEDADTFNKTSADDYEVRFRTYCAGVVSDLENLMVKPGVVAYGGI